MDPLILDARALQLASEVLGLLQVEALLRRRPFPEHPTLDAARRHTLEEQLTGLLLARDGVLPLAHPELEYLVRCCRGSEVDVGLHRAPWPHAWRYEVFFARLLERRPRSAAACRAVVAELLLPEVARQLEACGARLTGGRRCGHVLPPARLQEERQQLGAQLEALRALRGEAEAREVR